MLDIEHLLPNSKTISKLTLKSEASLSSDSKEEVYPQETGNHGIGEDIEKVNKTLAESVRY